MRKIEISSLAMHLRGSSWCYAWGGISVGTAISVGGEVDCTVHSTGVEASHCGHGVLIFYLCWIAQEGNACEHLLCTD